MIQEMEERYKALVAQEQGLREQFEQTRALLDATMGARQELEHWMGVVRGGKDELVEFDED